MSDYISREAAIEAFEKELSAKYNRIELSIGFVGAKSILSDLPAADVVERKTGTPCDLCRHNPPSSGDGKPCSYCPAE